jgi:6-phosphogluconolactonase
MMLYSWLPQADLPWNEIHLYFGDERAVPLNHPDSNFRLAQDAWLKNGLVPPENIHPMTTRSGNLRDDAERYDREMRRSLGSANGLDVAILGMGPDGHVCSLFPGHAALREKTKWVTAVFDSPKPPPQRLTLKLPALAATRCIFVAATGEQKAHAIGLAARPNSQVPLSLVIERAQRISLVLDQAAAGELNLPPAHFP